MPEFYESDEETKPPATARRPSSRNKKRPVLVPASSPPIARTAAGAAGGPSMPTDAAFITGLRAVGHLWNFVQPQGDETKTPKKDPNKKQRKVKFGVDFEVARDSALLSVQNGDLAQLVQDYEDFVQEHSDWTKQIAETRWTLKSDDDAVVAKFAKMASGERFRSTGRLTRNAGIDSIGGATLLIIASLYGSKEIVEFLVEKGANYTLSTNNDDTPLHLSNFMGHTALSKYLISLSDTNLLIKGNKKGLTPVEMLFLRNECDKGSVDFDHALAVCEAIKSRIGLKYIGKHGVSGRTPLDLFCHLYPEKALACTPMVRELSNRGSLKHAYKLSNKDKDSLKLRKDKDNNYLVAVEFSKADFPDVTEAEDSDLETDTE